MLFKKCILSYYLLFGFLSDYGYGLGSCEVLDDVLNTDRPYKFQLGVIDFI